MRRPLDTMLGYGWQLGRDWTPLKELVTWRGLPASFRGAGGATVSAFYLSSPSYSAIEAPRQKADTGERNFNST